MRRWLALASLAMSATAVGCAPSLASRKQVGPTGPPWSTLQEEQAVTLSVAKQDGSVDRRSMRAVLAVARPDRFRLRALGPGGVTLFDLLYMGGQVQVLGGILPKHDQFAAVVQSVGADLAAAFSLAPVGSRQEKADLEGMLITDGERSAHLTDFVLVDGKAVPLAIDVDSPAHHYQVHVQVTTAQVDRALDPALFEK